VGRGWFRLSTFSELTIGANEWLERCQDFVYFTIYQTAERECCFGTRPIDMEDYLNKPRFSSGSQRLEADAPPNKRAQSFQDVVLQSMREAQLDRNTRTITGNSTRRVGVIGATVKDIKSAASVTIGSIYSWSSTRATGRGVSSTVHQVPFGVQFQQSFSPPRATGEHRSTKMIDRSSDDMGVKSFRSKSLLHDLTWPFAVCGVEVAQNLPERKDLGPHFKRVKDAVTKAVHGDIGAANSLWKFASPGTNDDDDNTVGTLDTFQEENNQIRRLGSWGTVNTLGTNGTTDTGFNSHDVLRAPLEIRLGMEDDDGNVINPLLLEKAQQRIERKVSRREKVVKFEYPPIKSLRQCPRPNPEDLPALFFTEHELDQIEDDRYSTMSTDDIEIVAVSSRNSDTENDSRERSSTELHDDVETERPEPGCSVESRQSPSLSSGRDTLERERKNVRERPATPCRRRRTQEEQDEIQVNLKKTQVPAQRLVKGVQIYLRERSTGA